jgi:hypothetical protein
MLETLAMRLVGDGVLGVGAWGAIELAALAGA